MRSCDSVLLNYQDYLFGVTPRFYFRPAEMPAEEKSRKALKIVRWVIEEMLEWSPKDAKEHFGEKEVKVFKLERIIQKIIYPQDVSYRDYPYLISLIFPDEIEYDATEGIINMWDDILANEGKRFSGNLFDDESGKQRAYTLLEEFNRRYIPAANVSELYKAYADSSKINNLLREAKLFTSLSKLQTYPIGLLHEMIKNRYSGMEDEFLYAIYLYQNVQNNVPIKK